MALIKMDARDEHALVFLFIFLSVFPSGVLTGCQFPDALQGRWLRARDNQPLTIASADVSGHSISMGAKTISAFNCNVTSGSQYLLAAPSTLQSSGGRQIWAFFCWEFTRVTNITYLLYELTPNVSNNLRFVEETQSTITGACTLSKTNEEPTILYKLSSSATTVAVSTIAEATLPCPSDVFANYSYVADSARCSGKLDFCVDRSTSRETVGTCPTSTTYSAGGVLSCLTDFTINGVKYIMLINQDNSVTNTGSSYRFVCMKLTSTTQATVYPNNCTATTKHDLDLTIAASCPITTTTTPGPTTTTTTTTSTTTTTTTPSTTTTTTSTLPTQSVATSTSSSAGGDGGGGGGLAVVGVAVGASIGLVALAAIVVVAVVLLCKRATRVRAVTPTIPPTTNGNSHPVTNHTNHTDMEQPPTTAPDQMDPPSPVKPVRLPPMNSNATPRTEALRS